MWEVVFGGAGLMMLSGAIYLATTPWRRQSTGWNFVTIVAMVVLALLGIWAIWIGLFAEFE